MAIETTDVLIIGTGFGGSIPGYYFAAGGARVIMLERGPRFSSADFTQSLQVGTFSRFVDSISGNGIDVTAGNCVGGSSVVYYAASLRAPSFIFERTGTLGRRIWPASITRSTLDQWYSRVEETLPVSQLSWNDVPYAGGVFAAACTRAGHTCNPVPVAVDLTRCTNCNWMHSGCIFDAKRSMLLNYIPGAEASGADIRPLHEVQIIKRAQTAGYGYAVEYLELDPNNYSA
jgi:choline dehydrogenase-like flavoprotein